MADELKSFHQNPPRVSGLALDDLIPTKEDAIVSLQTGRDFDGLSIASQIHSNLTES